MIATEYNTYICTCQKCDFMTLIISEFQCEYKGYSGAIFMIHTNHRKNIGNQSFPYPL